MDEGLIRQVKEWVADPTKAPMLRDLLQTEAGRAIDAMHVEGFAAGAAYSKDELARRVTAYEALSEDLGRAAALMSYWSSSTDDRLVPEIVARLANAMDRGTGARVWLDLCLYPAVLVLYSAGIGAVVGRREEHLANLLASATVREQRELKAVALVLNAATVIEHRLAQELPGLERRHTPMSDHLCETLRPWLQELEPDEAAFEWAFDRFEYLLGLLVFDLTRQTGRHAWGPVGRFSWRGEYGDGVDSAIAAEITAAGPAWPLIRAGLFGRDVDRLAESATGWNQHVAAVRMQRR